MFETVSPEGIKRRIFETLAASGVAIDTSEGSYTDALIAPAVLEIWKVYMSLNGLLPMVYPDETSGEYIDKKCAYYGIVRKAGIPAEVTLSVTGKNGTTVPSGAVFLTEEGLRFSSDVTAIVADGTVSFSATADEAGTGFNVGAGQIIRQLSSIPGVAAVTNPAAATGGTDPETDAALVRRLYARLREAATSGNVSHYKQWALEASGVGAAKVLPLWQGAGTVKVLIASGGMGPVDRAVVLGCAAHIEERRPIGAAVTVETVEALAIDVSATVRVDASMTKEAVRTAFAAALGGYLRGIAFSQYTVAYTRIGYLLAGIDGVLDYSELTLNGATGNVTIGDGQTPRVGEVNIYAAG